MFLLQVRVILISLRIPPPALRAIEISADLLLKATQVDGVYDADPKTDPTAKKFQQLGFDEVLKRQLGVMDLTAITLCLENDLPLRVYEMRSEGALARILDGQNEGTLVTNQYISNFCQSVTRVDSKGREND